jgi:hypothetical protein
MKWDIEYTDEFENWWKTLSEDEQDSVAVSVGLLEEKGPSLPFPYSSGIIGSEFSNMRELRTQHAGEPYRTLYAFDSRRCAILLIGGNKAGRIPGTPYIKGHPLKAGSKEKNTSQ